LESGVRVCSLFVAFKIKSKKYFQLQNLLSDACPGRVNMSPPEHYTMLTVNLSIQIIMKLMRLNQSFVIYSLIAIQICFLTSCNTKSYNSKHKNWKIGILGFYLDMDYLKVKRTMDSLLNIRDLQYFETADLLGNKQKSLYHNFSEISPFLYAKVNIKGAYIIDERLTSIQLTLCSRLKTAQKRFSYNCDLKELKSLFELYKEKYGTPSLLGQGEKYDYLSRKISNVYSPGPKGRLFMDKIYFWDRGNYIIYFDFGYPVRSINSENPGTRADIHDQRDSTSAPIVYYDFTQDYIDKLLDKASNMKEGQIK
jgi:hypothetical protein